MAECIATIEFCKAASDIKERGANLVLHFARRWAPNTTFGAAESCRPSEAEGQTGFQYNPGAGGVSNGASEPKWPKVLTGPKSTVNEGAITWQTEALSVVSLHERIAGVTWDIPAGITFDEVAFVNTAGDQVIGGQWGGGTAGQVYIAEALVTTTRANKKLVRFILTIDAEAEAA